MGADIIKVLVVTTPIARELSAVWQAASHHGVDIVLAGAVGEVGLESYKLSADSLSIPVVPLTPSKWFESRGHTWRTWKNLAKVIEQEAPDIVHVHSEVWGFPVRQALKLHPRVTAHGADNLFSFGSFAERKLRLALAHSNLQRIKGYASWNSQGVALAARHGLALGAPTTVVPIGVPERSLVGSTTRNAVSDRGRLRLTFVGRLLPEKGIDTFVDALNMLQPKDRSRVILSVIGDGPEVRHLERVDPLIEVEYEPNLPHADIPGLLANSSAVIIPSRDTARWSEQFCRVAVEAMSVGCPVIASDAGALPEVVQGGGLIFRAHDADHLSSLIRDWLSNPEFSFALGGIGKSIFERDWAPDVLGLRLTRFWDAIDGA